MSFFSTSFFFISAGETHTQGEMKSKSQIRIGKLGNKKSQAREINANKEKYKQLRKSEASDKKANKKKKKSYRK